MKFIKLRQLCNARIYVLEIYGANEGHCSEELDMENDNDKMWIARYADAEVVRFQPIITDDDASALEVELNA